MGMSFGKQQLRASDGDVRTYFFVLVVLVTLFYVAAYMTFVHEVFMKSRFLYGFYRYDEVDIRPGPFVDDRYDVPWIFILLDSIRLLYIPCGIFMFQPYLSKDRVKAALVVYQIGVVLDIVIIISLLLLRGLRCNALGFRNGVCNDKNLTEYCEVYWESQPQVCPNNTFVNTTTTIYDLRPDTQQWNMTYYTLGFLGIDAIYVLFIWLLDRFSPRVLFPRMGYYY